MTKVLVEIFPPLGDKLAKKPAGRIKLEEEIDEHDTIRSLFGRMAEKHDGFEFLYDSKRQLISGYVLCIVNESTLPALDGMDTRVKDGDRISFIPEFVGGM